MARKAAMNTLAQISDINMTPLMDLTFLLLITFIITFPLVEQGIPVNLPKGKAQELPQKKTATLSLNGRGDIFLDKTPVPKNTLARTLTALKAKNEDLTVLVRADEKLDYGKVIQVLKVLYDCKITRMALVTQGVD
ncbi:MAG: biopolymer transporter ExbD [Kiritimatiellia bacterium]